MNRRYVPKIAKINGIHINLRHAREASSKRITSFESTFRNVREEIKVIKKESFWENIECSIEKLVLLFRLSRYYNADFHWLLTSSETKVPLNLVIMDPDDLIRATTQQYLETLFGDAATVFSVRNGREAMVSPEYHHADFVLSSFRPKNATPKKFFRQLKSIYTDKGRSNLDLSVDNELKVAV